MALSEQEQRMLEEIERALIADDPRLAHRASKDSQGTFAFNIQSGAIMLVGLCMLVGGVSLAQFSLWFVALSILGFFTMFAGGMMAFHRTGTRSKAAKGKGAGSAKVSAASSRAAKNGGIGDRMEDSFRKRFER